MKINLGCGANLRAGWLNIDILDLPNSETYLKHDLSTGLPSHLMDVDLIYSSHFLEHLTIEQSRKLLKDCHKALKVGGKIRLCLPDFKSAAKAYVESNREYFQPLVDIHLAPLGKAPDSLIDCLADFCYQYVDGVNEHRDIWDHDKAFEELFKVGFQVNIEDKFNPEIDIDNELRRLYSFYIEGTKVS